MGAQSGTVHEPLPSGVGAYAAPMVTDRGFPHGASAPEPPPSEALAELVPPDVHLDTGAGLRHPDARTIWLGVVWGRLGRGDLAAAHFDRVTAPSLQPWIGAERGRLLRELGGHAAAERLEEPALHLAEDPVDQAMLLLSLAADAVGQGRPATAQHRLAAAQRVLAQVAPPGPRADRQRVRAGWVEVEVAWLTGRAPEPSGLPSVDALGAPVVPAIYRAGSRFHLAKGLLFAGVVRGEVRALDLALELAPPALWWAVQLARGAAGVSGAEDAGNRARAAIVPLPG
jgi:hypothetical protein